MNNQSFERQLQQIDPPAPDPEARVRARQAALAQFEQIHTPVHRSAPALRRWNGPWVAGLAAASVAVVGVAIYWQVPESEREVTLPATAVDIAQAPGGLEQQPVAIAQVVEHQEVAAGDEAAAAAEPLEKLEGQVTGPRRDAPDARAAVKPSTIVAEQELRESAAVPAADAVTPRQQPLVAGAANGQQIGGNTITNARGLDPASGSRTLTLVDGRRTRSESSQADAQSMEQVVVTGTRIQSPGAPPAPPPGNSPRSQIDTDNALASIGGLRPQSWGAPIIVMPPAAAQGDQFESFETNAVKSTADEPVSTLSVDVDTTSYSFVRRMLNSGQLPPADAVRAEEMINYFDYAWPAAQSRQQPFRPTVTVSNSPWGEGRKLVHVGIKGYELPARSQPDANLVLLIDVSGSMNSPDKLPLVKQSMKLLLDSLKSTDTVSIVVYAGAAGQVLPPTAVRDRESIEAALDGLRPGGSTAGAQGIRLAYDLAQRSFRNGGVNRILLATDGDFNVGVSDPQELERLVERERGRGVYLSVLGFGQGNYRDDIAQALAQNGNGVAAYIDTLSEARKVLVREATSSLFTIAGDVKIQVEFNPATVAEYRLVGYETRALNREDFNNDKVDAGEVGSGRTVTAIYEITPADSPARMIDAPRYGGPAAASPRGKASEYGFVKIRYKLPGAEQSQLIEQPIRVDADVPRALREDVAFSTAVAGFAQLLRDGRYTGTLTYEDVLRQAASNRGRDPYGYRAEFLELVRKAQQSADAAATRE